MSIDWHKELSPIRYDPMRDTIHAADLLGMLPVKR